jgi:tRNA (guanine37-N1)-methyltransferase
MQYHAINYGMKINVISICPQAFSALNCGVIGRALPHHPIMLWNPRHYSTHTHRQVDDKPYGSGPGQIMQAEPLMRTVESIFEYHKQTMPVWLTTPQGKPFDHQSASHHAHQTEQVIIVCGRYQGIDQRFIDRYVDVCWSIGNCVVSGGELPAMMIIDAMLRQQPGTLGNPGSKKEETFSTPGQHEHPHYTTPQTIENMTVPNILLSGHPKKIASWRKTQQTQDPFQTT